MLEILAILWLANANGRKAQNRGRKPGGFKALTVILWVGGELLGFYFGYARDVEFPGVYLYAVGFAIAGAILSRIIVSVWPRGAHRPIGEGPLSGAKQITSPVTLTITREKSFVGGMMPFSFRLNGSDIGDVRNGDVLKARTSYQQNILVATDRQGNEYPPLTFAVAEGVEAQIYFQAGKFLEDMHRGIFLLSEENLAELREGRPITAPDVIPAPMVSALPPAVPPDAPRPMRVCILLGLALLCLVLVGLVKVPEELRSTYSHWRTSGLALRDALVALLWGGSLYLFLQPKAKQWAYGLAFLPLTALATSFCYAGLITDSVGEALASDFFRSMLRSYLIEAGLVAAVGLLFSLFQKDRQKVAGPAWMAALLVTAFSVYLNQPYISAQGLFTPAGISLMFHWLQSALMLVMAVFYCRALCNLRSRRIQITGGARFWCILVVVMSTAAQVVLLLTPGTRDPWTLLPALVGIIGMLLLSTNRRIGFQLALLGIGATAMMGLNGVIQDLRVGNFASLGAAAGAGANLLITWAVTYGARNSQSQRRMRAGSGRARPVHWVYKAAGILDVIFGAGLLGLGVWSLIVQVRGFQWQPFVFGVVTGAVLLLFGALCLRQCFRKDKRPIWGLLITGLVFAGLIVAILLLALAIAIMDALR